MKRLATALLFGKDSRFSGLIAFAIVGAIALGCTCNKELGELGKPDSSNSSTTSNSTTTDTTDPSGVPSESALQSMVTETTEDFAQAIDTNDFGDIYEKSSTDFQKTYTEEQMKEAFKLFVNKKRLILPSLNKAGGTTAEFSPAPRIRSENGLEILVLNGTYPTKPHKVKFEYEYVKRAGDWKLLKLIVNM